MNNIDFTTGKMLPKMIKFSLPLIFAIVLQALYGAVDLVIVGNYGNSASQAAVATGGHIMQTFTGIITGFTMGITVVIGRFIGAKEDKYIGKVVGNTVIIFTIIAVIITAVSIGLEGVFVRLLQVPEEAIDGCLKYMFICSIGFIFVVAYNVISGFFRGIGNSNLPLFFIAIACIVNIALDFLFVKGLHMDAIGAAIATVLAQAISVIISIITMYKKKDMFHISKDGFKLDNKIIKDIFKIGLPIALQDGLTNMSFLVIHSLINGMGISESAGIGIAERLFGILSIVPMSYLTVMATVVSQNDGAGLQKRTNLALLEGTSISFLFGLATFFLSYFGAEFLIRIFTLDNAVVECTIGYIRISSFEYLLISIAFCFMGYFNGRGHSLFVMAQGLTATFLCRIPLSFYYSGVENAKMWMMAIPIPISASVTLGLCLIYFVILHFRDKRIQKKEGIQY